MEIMNVWPPLVAPPLSNIAQIHEGSDISGVVGGNTSFCATHPDSAYMSAYFGEIWNFYITYDNGEVQPVYCLEHGRRGPNGNTFQSRPPEVALPDYTREQVDRMVWIIANSYPVMSANQLFTKAGVDLAVNPPLDANDAYAATQVALWSAVDPPPDASMGWTFLDCSSRVAHPKSARLKQVVTYLYNGAMAQATEHVTEALCRRDGCCRSVSPGGGVQLTDCGSSELRPACGKLLYGPLRVGSPSPFTLQLEAVCEPECPRGFVSLSDGCGQPITMPASGQEFYVALPEVTTPACYRLTIRVERTVVSVALLFDLNQPPHPTRMQTVGGTPIRFIRTDSASLCFCVAPPCKVQEPCPQVCIQVPPCPPPCIPQPYEPCPATWPAPSQRPAKRRLLPGQRPYYPPK